MACRSCLLTLAHRLINSQKDTKDPTFDVTSVHRLGQLQLYALLHIPAIFFVSSLRASASTPHFTVAKKQYPYTSEVLYLLTYLKYIKVSDSGKQTFFVGPYPLKGLPLKYLHFLTCLLISHFIYLPRKLEISTCHLPNLYFSSAGTSESFSNSTSTLPF